MALYQARWSAPAIADRHGCSPSTIDQRLNVAGVARRPVSPRVSRPDLIEALDRGLPAPEIAAALGVSLSLRVPSLGPRTPHDQHSGRQTTTKTPVPRALPQPTPPGANV